MTRVLAAVGLSGALVWAGLVGCGGENSLSGSVGDLFPLEVSRVEVQRNTQALQVSYYRSTATDVDLVVRLSVDTEGLELKPGQKVDLAGETPAGHARATVVHVAAGEPARTLAPVDKGDLVLDEGGNPGEPTRGDFSMSFKKDGGYGAGRTLSGRFSSLALDGGFGPEPLPQP
ncbi:hypothetical protein DAT35_19065 [Vitiosangium sp. GDMCC 1.1324]|nr:hypothetical protein DAT35_19065 [Vitiosangium sp. GDMCC 1.1324]